MYILLEQDDWVGHSTAMDQFKMETNQISYGEDLTLNFKGQSTGSFENCVVIHSERFKCDL